MHMFVITPLGAKKNMTPSELSPAKASWNQSVAGSVVELDQPMTGLSNAADWRAESITSTGLPLSAWVPQYPRIAPFVHPGVDACAPWAVSAMAATVTGTAIAASITLILYIFPTSSPRI